MNDEEWLRTAALGAMLVASRNRVTERKRRLFACACCRQLWSLLTDERSRQAVALGERMADQGLDEEVVRTSREAAEAVFQTTRSCYRGTQGWIASWAAHAGWVAATAALQTLGEFEAIREYPYRSDPDGGAWLLQEAARDLSRAAGVQDASAWNRAGEEHQALQVVLIRHLFDNPFRPRPPLPTVPPLVRELAEAVYQQDREAGAALHDALLEGGLDELAAHFHDAGEWHPKGCWAVDALTGRT